MSLLGRRAAVLAFLAFAFTYFFSALVRAVTATLAPTLTREFSLNAGDLGLLAGGYFLGFAAVQLPLGRWLDRHGPKKVLLSFLVFAVAGCLAFALAASFAGLLAARILCGVGVSACLMAPLTGFRSWLQPHAQLRANSWMLMSGSMGMVASTLPVQWLLPIVGWRPLFVGLAVLIALAMAFIAWTVPASPRIAERAAAEGEAPRSDGALDGLSTPGYSAVWRHPYFRRMAPVGFFCWGGLLAMQTLWAGPWMVRVAGFTPLAAATGLFWINVSMLVTFSAWGFAMPALARRGLVSDHLIACGLPLNFLVLAAIIVLGDAAGAGAAALWALFCVTCTFVSLAQPAVGMAFPKQLAGRALSGYNLVIFSGVFCVQWGIGLLVDAGLALGLSEVGAFRCAMSVFLACSVASWIFFLVAGRDNSGRTVAA